MNTISFLIYSMEMGGTERVSHDLINEYVSRGYNVTLICLQKTGDFLRTVKIPDTNIFEIGTASTVRGIFRLARKVETILNETNTDKLIAMGEFPNIIAPFAKFNGEYVIVEHSTKTFYTEPTIYNLNFFMRFLAKLAYKKANKILCVSQNIKDLIVSKNARLSDKTFVIYNPIDFETISEKSKENIDYHSKKIKIISVGRITIAKNYPLLIKAFSKLHEANENTELWFVGDGSQKSELKLQCKALGIEDSVIFWGYQQNPYKYIKSADFFVSSSNYEGFGLVVFEALTLNKRVILTNCLSDYNTLITSDLGRVVPIKDEDALYHAMKKEIEDAKKIKNTPEILNIFSLRTIADKYLEYLQ